MLEKGSEIGAHILSGAVIDPRGLAELLPDWQARGAPLDTPVTEDRFLILTADKAYRIPNWTLPRLMDNHGNYIASLGNVCRWLGAQAEALGVEIYPGFAAAEVLFDDAGAVAGVATGDMGIAKDGSRKPDYQPGMELRAKYTLFAEGCRGSLSQELMKRYNLRDGVDPQKYGIGLKELWQVDPSQHRKGLVVHSQGWPLDAHTGGGSFVYHYGDNLVACGFVVHLNYGNPHLSPYDEFQRFKTHPGDPRHVRRRQATRLRRARDQRRRPPVGAEARVPGRRAGRLRGRASSTCRASRASHNAMKTGMLAAESAFAALAGRPRARRARRYDDAWRTSWVYEDLWKVRNVKPGLKWGMWLGTLHGGIHMWLERPRASARSSRGRCATASRDHETLAPARGESADRLPELRRRAHVRQAFVGVPVEHQPRGEPAVAPARCRDPAIPVAVNLAVYDGPEQRYCPAGVYEFVDDMIPRPGGSGVGGAGPSACRSTRRTACTARPATSRTRGRTSCGSCPKAAAARTIRACRR